MAHLARPAADRPPPPLATALALPLAIALFSLLPSGPLGVLFVLLVCPLLSAGGLTWSAGRAGTLAGAMSFPLYVIHFPLLIGGTMFDVPLPLALAATLASAFVVAVAPSALADRYRAVTMARQGKGAARTASP